MMERKYGAAATISFPLIEFSLTSFHNSLTSTVFAAGDLKISKDYGGYTDTATLPSAFQDGRGAVLSLTAAELQAAHIDIQIVDQTATKVWEDQQIQIETFGNTTSAQFQFDRSVNEQSVVVSSITSTALPIQASLTANNAVVVSSITSTAFPLQASLTADQSAVTVGTLNNLGASATAQINSEVDTALTDIGLDHLVAASVSGTDITDNSIIAKIVSATSTADWDSFTSTTDSLEAIRDRGDAAWITGGGGSATQTAQLVWDLTASAHATSDTFGGRLQNSVPSLPIQASLTSDQSGITFGTVNNLGASATAQVNAEADTALSDLSVTANVMNTIITNLDAAVTTRSSHTATDAANAVFNATITSTSFAADTAAERLIAIDNKLPGGSISGFDPAADTVQASLTANQTGVTIATVTDITNAVNASITSTSVVQSVTNTVNASITTSSVISTVNNLGSSATSQINAEVSDVLKTDTISEQSVGTPTATPTFEQAIGYFYMTWRNQGVVTSSKLSISNDAGSTITSATISDDGSTFTKEELA